MSNILRATLVTLGIVLVASGASHAGTENIFASGDCANGKKWWSVSTFHDGRLSVVMGLDCDGKIYMRYSYLDNVPSDPTAGETPNYVGSGWYALARYDDLHRIVWIGGKDISGQFYVSTIDYPVDDGTGGDEPQPGVR